MSYRSSLFISLFFCTASICAVDIFHAINIGNKHQVKQWIITNENINQLNQDGQTALIASVIRGNLNIVSEISKVAIDLNVVDNYGKTALDWAADYGDRRIIRHLIVIGCKAAQQNSIDCIKVEFQKKYTRSRVLSLLGAALIIIPFFVVSLVVGIWAILVLSSYFAGLYLLTMSL